MNEYRFRYLLDGRVGEWFCKAKTFNDALFLWRTESERSESEPIEITKVMPT